MPETYRKWRLPQLWEMLSADEPTDAHLHLSTLRRQQTALETQRDRLRTLRDQLAQSWPPEKSEAASAYIQRLNDMIRIMSLTANGAAEVRSRVSLIVEAIDQARHELQPLVDDYQRTSEVSDQRVGEHSRKLLDERARRILMTADAEVAEPAAKLNVGLPTYQRFNLLTNIPATPAVGDSGSGGGLSKGGVGRSAIESFAAPQFNPPAPTASLPLDDAFGLAAQGVNDLVQPGAPSFLPGVGGAGAAGGSSEAAALVPGRVLGISGLPHGIGMPGSTATTGGLGPRGVTGGGVPGTRSMIGTPGVGGTAARAAGGAGGFRDRSFDEYASRRRVPSADADEIWSVERGVPPLIDVPPLQPHNPGPGVLGIDR